MASAQAMSSLLLALFKQILKKLNELVTSIKTIYCIIYLEPYQILLVLGLLDLSRSPAMSNSVSNSKP